MKQEVLISSKIKHLKNKLKETDYQAIKFVEGELSLAEFKPIKEQRSKMRKEINALEEELAKLQEE